MTYQPIGSPEWKRQERDYLIAHIEWQRDHIEKLKGMSEGSLEFLEMIAREEAILEQYRNDLKLLREGGGEYEDRYRRS